MKGQRVHSFPSTKNATTYAQCCCQGKPKVFQGGSSSYSPPSMYQNSRLPKGKQVFSINQSVYTNNPGTVNHLYDSGNGSSAKFLTPANGHAASKPFQGQQSQACCVNSSKRYISIF